MNATFRYNIFKNIYGSGYFEPQGEGCSGLHIYGNVFWGTDANEYSANGILCFTASDYGDDITFHNNTIYHCNLGAAGYAVYSNIACTNFFARNNIFQDCNLTPLFSPTVAESNNEKNTGLASFLSAAAGDFHLTAETDAGLDVGSPYDIDPDGVTRGTGAVWDLGAYEYADPSAPYMRFY
jgi:hypothetical protein